MSLTLNSALPIQFAYPEGKEEVSDQKEVPSLSGHIVKWIRADRPLYKQAVVYTTVAIAALALILSYAGIFLIAPLVDEYKQQAKVERLKKLDEPLITLLGGPPIESSLPVLQFQQRDATQPSSLPRLEEMRVPIMKGSDRYLRPVLCFRIYDKTTHTSFVEMIYRKYSLEEVENPWIRTPNEHSIFDGALVIQGNALTKLGDVIKGTDPRYRL